MSSSRKIVHVCAEMDIGGLERAVFQLARSQVQRGDRVTVVATAGADRYAQASREAGAQVVLLDRTLAASGISARRFAETCADADIIHFQWRDPLLMWAVSSLAGRTRMFYTQRSGTPRWQFKQKLTYYMARHYIRRGFTAVSGNTDFAAAVAARLYGFDRHRVLTTYNGIDFDLLRGIRPPAEVRQEMGSPPDDAVLVGTTAKLVNWKRTHILVRAMALARSPHLRCYIIGDGPCRRELESLARELGVVERVIFLGRKAHVGDYLQLLDAFVLPSNDTESFGNSAVEAIGLGIPTIVMRDGGGLLEHITPGGGFVAADETEVALLLDRLAESPALRAEAGRIGSAYVRQKYTYDNMVAGYERLYASSHL
jgi:glycosyltransferase involved in cell wall biosynthesis